MELQKDAHGVRAKSGQTAAPEALVGLPLAGMKWVLMGHLGPTIRMETGLRAGEVGLTVLRSFSCRPEGPRPPGPLRRLGLPPWTCPGLAHSCIDWEPLLDSGLWQAMCCSPPESWSPRTRHTSTGMCREQHVCQDTSDTRPLWEAPTGSAHPTPSLSILSWTCVGF